AIPSGAVSPTRQESFSKRLCCTKSPDSGEIPYIAALHGKALKNKTPRKVTDFMTGFSTNLSYSGNFHKFVFI
ncbi:MAG: hypothetical protein PHW88_06555, partial [Bacteroidales bacterium]|nr:hypothetical protein [Bacteroidales bacterium]